MPLRLHYLQHVPFEGPGHIADLARELGFDVTGTMLYDGGALPDISYFDFLVVMGGPMGVHDEELYPWLAEEKNFIGRSIKAGRTVLGVCLGAQLIASALGAGVRKARYREIGWYTLSRTPEACDTALGRVLPESFTAFHWHGDTFDVPRGAVHLLRSAGCGNQAFVHDGRVLALQFHLETTAETVSRLIENSPGDLSPGKYVQEIKTLRDPALIDSNHGILREIMAYLAGVTVSQRGS